MKLRGPCQGRAQIFIAEPHMRATFIFIEFAAAYMRSMKETCIDNIGNEASSGQAEKYVIDMLINYTLYFKNKNACHGELQKWQLIGVNFYYTYLKNLHML